MSFLNIPRMQFSIIKGGRRVVLAQQHEFIEMKNHGWGLT
jgi:hypothetical protein